MTERKVFKKYVNLSKNKLNAKNNKEGYAKNDVMTSVIKLCGCEKKEAKEKQKDSEKIDDSRI